ncbi:MAG TPA: hypothetical protein VFF13_02545 [archaeon]|nr:hypothetical protein [archaeon]
MTSRMHKIRAVGTHHGVEPLPLWREIREVNRTVLEVGGKVLSIAKDNHGSVRVMIKKGRHQVRASVSDSNYYYRTRRSIEMENGNILCPVEDKKSFKKELKVVTKRGRYIREPTPEERGSWAIKFQKI